MKNLNLFRDVVPESLDPHSNFNQERDRLFSTGFLLLSNFKLLEFFQVDALMVESFQIVALIMESHKSLLDCQSCYIKSLIRTWRLFVFLGKTNLKTRKEVLIKILDWGELNLNRVDEEHNLTELMTNRTKLNGLTNKKKLLDLTNWMELDQFYELGVYLYPDSRSSKVASLKKSGRYQCKI